MTTSTAHIAVAGTALTFREVLAAYPYKGATSSAPGRYPGCKKLIAVAAKRPSAQLAIFADAAKKACYVVGPVLLTGAAITQVWVSHDAAIDGSVVNVHFHNDDFLHKIADVEVGKQIALVLDGVVLSAPTINPGITGRDVEISGDFDEAAANRIAQELGAPNPTP